MAPPSLYVSRPRLSLNGQVNSSVSGNVLALLVEETTDGLARAEVVLSNYGFTPSGADFLYFKRDQIDFGKELLVEVGPGDDTQVIFRGRVSGLEAAYPRDGGPRLVVLLEDRLQDLRLTRRTRSFENVSDADVIRQIANEHSLTPQVNLDGPTHKSLAQVNLSDLAFVRSRARSLGGELWVDGTTLHATTRPNRGEVTLALRYGEELLQFEVRADLAHQCSEVGVTGWDVSAKQAIEETGDSSALGAELGNLLGGAHVLEQAFSARKERVVHDLPLTAQEARAVASARYLARARRFVTGTGVADGAPRLRVGCAVTLSGLGDLFNGDFYVSRVQHTYELDNGYRTEFDVERPGIGRPQA